MSRLEELQHARASLARAERLAKREQTPDSRAAVAQIRREYAELKLVDYIERTVSAAPPLDAEQRARIAGLLGGAA